MSTPSSGGRTRRPSRPRPSRTRGRSNAALLRRPLEASLQLVPFAPWQLSILPSLFALTPIDRDVYSAFLKQRNDFVQIHLAHLLVAHADKALGLEGLYAVLSVRAEPAEHLGEELVNALLEEVAATLLVGDLAHQALGVSRGEPLLVEDAVCPPGERLVAGVLHGLKHGVHRRTNERKRCDDVRPAGQRIVEEADRVTPRPVDLALQPRWRVGPGQVFEQRVDRPRLP